MTEQCEVSRHHASNDEIKEIIEKGSRVAIVGLSAKTARPSNEVAMYLQEHGYTIIPVNPVVESVLGQKSYPDLISVPGEIDIVDIFRKPEAIGPIVEEAIKVGAKVVWMQEGIINNEAADRAKAAGVRVVMNRCIKKEHMLYFG